MNRMKMACMGVVAVFVAAALVTASSPVFSTPLYTYRMEQHSDGMNFLPSTVNSFTYTAENGYTLDYTGCCGIVPSDVEPTNEQHLCQWSVETCPLTCLNTCPNTCVQSCPNTCSAPTCEGSTCGDPPC